MACDIHVWAERREDGCWEVVGCMPEALETHDYGMFGFLAGIRNYSAVTPIAECRGLPQDASVGVREALQDCDGAHSASWLSLEELLSFNYDQITEDRRVEREIGPIGIDGRAIAEPGGGQRTTYREFLGDRFLQALEELKAAGAERIVFWFDN
jgi:hypothetical protein